MEKARLFLKGESISNLTEYNFANMVNDKIESGVPACILINIIKDTEQTASDLNDLVVSKLVGVRRVLQDIRATSPKVVVEVELSSNDYIRLMKAIGNGYSLTGYSSELKMRVSSLSKNDVTYLASNPAIKNREDNTIQEQNKAREDKMKNINKLSISTPNTEIKNASKFDIFIGRKNKAARPIKIAIDSNSAYYRGEYIGSIDLKSDLTWLTLEDNDNTKLLYQALKDNCSHVVNPHLEGQTLTFTDTNGFVSIFKSRKIFFLIKDAIKNSSVKTNNAKLESKVAKSTDNTRLKLAESTQTPLDKYLDRSYLESNTKKEMIETIVNSFSHIENNDSAFNLKRHILTTLRKDPRLSPLTRVSLNKAIVALQGSNIQENIPGEIELKVDRSIMSLKHHTSINNNRKENYLAIIEIMDASFKCPITDLSVCKNTDGSIDKIMVTASVSAKALKAIKMYGLNFRYKAGIVIGRLIERNTGNYVAHISVLSQEDSLYYRRYKSLKDFDGDIINYSIPESNLRNPVLPEDLNPENKTFKHVSEITDKYLSRLLNVSISRGITKNGLESIITTIPIAKFSKREYLDSFVQRYSFQYKFNKMFSDKNEAGLSYRNNKDFEMYIIDDKAGYPQLDIKHENNIFTASSRVYIPIGLLIKLGAKTFKELHNKVTDDCELDVDFNVDTKSANPEPISTQSKDSEAEYKSILYPEVKFERLKDAKKYADAINEGIRDTLKSSNEISNLPILTIDDFKVFKAYIEKATIGTSHHEGFKDNMAYSVVLCIYVPNEVIKKLKEDSISLEDIIGYALENIQICKKGKLKNITMATPGFPIGVYFNKINQYLGNNNSIWTQKDGDTVKTYRVLYTYVKNTKIKALAIEKE